MTAHKKPIKTELINPSNLSKELQEYVKDGNPLVVVKTRDPKTSRMEGKDGRIIWDGENFVFFPEKEKP